MRTERVLKLESFECTHIHYIVDLIYEIYSSEFSKGFYSTYY